MIIDVKDASGEVVTLPTLPVPGQTDRAGSLPTTLATEDLAAILTALGLLGTEAKLEALRVILAGSKTDLDGILTAILGLATEAKLEAVRALLAGPIPAGANTIGKVEHTTTGIGHNSKVVATAGTDVAIAASAPAKWVVVQAYAANTGKIAVGAAGVDAAGSGTGLLLSAGESITIPIDNLADVFIDATVSGEGVRFTYGT